MSNCELKGSFKLPSGGAFWKSWWNCEACLFCRRAEEKEPCQVWLFTCWLWEINSVSQQPQTSSCMFVCECPYLRKQSLGVISSEVLILWWVTRSLMEFPSPSKALCFQNKYRRNKWSKRHILLATWQTGGSFWNTQWAFVKCWEGSTVDFRS